MMPRRYVRGIEQPERGRCRFGFTVIVRNSDRREIGMTAYGSRGDWIPLKCRFPVATEEADHAQVEGFLRPHSLRLSPHRIARSSSISQSTVHEYVSAAQAASIR